MQIYLGIVPRLFFSGTFYLYLLAYQYLWYFRYILVSFGWYFPALFINNDILKIIWIIGPPYWINHFKFEDFDLLFNLRWIFKYYYLILCEFIYYVCNSLNRVLKWFFGLETQTLLNSIAVISQIKLTNFNNLMFFRILEWS